MNIVKITQHADFKNNHTLRYTLEGGNALHGNYPSHVGQSNSRADQIARKAYYHNLCMAEHPDSALNKEQLQQFWKQIVKAGLENEYAAWSIYQ